MKRFGTSEQQLHVEVYPQEKIHPQFRKSTVYTPYYPQNLLYGGEKVLVDSAEDRESTGCGCCHSIYRGNKLLSPCPRSQVLSVFSKQIIIGNNQRRINSIIVDPVTDTNTRHIECDTVKSTCLMWITVDLETTTVVYNVPLSRGRAFSSVFPFSDT